jgi:hypothetical protein
MMLTLPRVAPIDAAALEHWLGEARHGARLNHPHLAPVAEVGVHEHWPYVACQRALGVTLAERLGAAKLPRTTKASAGCARRWKALPSRTTPASPITTCSSTVS